MKNFEIDKEILKDEIKIELDTWNNAKILLDRF